MNQAGDELSGALLRGVEIPVIHSRGVVAIQDDQGSRRERLDVIPQQVIQQARTVEVILPPDRGVRE